MRIHFLGTGSAEPDARRHNLSLLLGFGKDAVLVDCSSCPAQNILRAGYELDAVNNIVLTHSHTDHIYGLPSFVHSLWLNGGLRKGKQVTIHGLPATLEVAKRLIDVFGLSEKRSAVKITWQPVEPGHELIMEKIPRQWKFDVFSVHHADMPTIGLDILRPSGSRILFSSDARADELIRGRIIDATKVLIHDCGGKIDGTRGHAGAVEISALVRDTQVEDLHLVHLPPLKHGEKQEILGIIGKTYSGRLSIPNDSDHFDYS